MELVTYFHFY